MAKKKKKKLVRRGNFRRVTPKVAKRYADAWAKKGILRPQDIPDQGSPEKTRLAQIRLREAQYWLDDYARRLAHYEEQKAIFDAAKAKKIVLDNGLAAKLVRPSKPKFTDARSARGGNFKPVSKAQAERYLRHIFLKPPKGAATPGSKGHKKLDLKDFMSITSYSGPGDKFIPRIQEAVEVAGMKRTLELFNAAKESHARAAKRAAEKAAAAEKRKAQADARKLKKLAEIEARCQKTLDKVAEDRRKLGAVVASARRRARRAMKRARARAR